jgi:RNA polymerase sigma factor for flagellar operon FliA
MAQHRKPKQPLTEAQRRLVEVHRNLVTEIATELRKQYPSESRDTLESYGYSGLTEAAITYQPERSTAFRVYAVRRVRGSIQDGVRQNSAYEPPQIEQKRESRRLASEIAAGLAARKQQITTTIAGLMERFDRQPNPQRVPAERAEDVIAEGDSPETAVDRQRKRASVRSTLTLLDPKERDVISEVHFHGRTLEQAAARIGGTKSWAQKKYVRGMAKLKGLLAGRKGREG